MRISNKDKKAISSLFMSQATMLNAIRELEIIVPIKKDDEWNKLLRQCKLIGGQLDAIGTRIADNVYNDKFITDSINIAHNLLRTAEGETNK